MIKCDEYDEGRKMRCAPRLSTTTSSVPDEKGAWTQSLESFSAEGEKLKSLLVVSSSIFASISLIFLLFLTK